MKRFCGIALLLCCLCTLGHADETGLLKGGTWIKKIRTDHPRLFVTKGTIPSIREVAKNQPEVFEKLKADVAALPDDAPYIELTDLFKRNEKGVITPNIPGTQAFKLLKYGGGREAAQCALMYLITGEKSYVKKTVAYLKLANRALEFSANGQIWADLAGQSRINAMFAYDLIYNELTPEERREVILPLLDYVKKSQPGSTYTFRRTHGNYNNGNYGETALQYFLGITLYGDGIADEDADRLLRRGTELFVKMMDFRDKISGSSGLLSATTVTYAFGNYPWATILFLRSWKCAFGEDISDRWKQMLNYHRFVEGMTFDADDKGFARLHGIGDLPHDNNRYDLYGLYTHLAWNIHFYGKKYPEVADEIYHYLGCISPDKRNLTPYMYPMIPFLITGFDPARVGHGKPGKQTHFYCHNFGLLTMWSGRGKDDTYASFRFGSRLDNHQHYDELSFVIFKHDYLALDSGSRTETGHHHNFAAQSVAHNTILIHMDKEAMPPFWKAWGYKPDGKTYYNHGGQYIKTAARPIALEVKDDYIYAAGDATESYHPDKSKEVVRQFVWIKPDIFVIYDRVASVKPDQKKEFLLHFQNKPESIAPNTWRADLNKGRLFVQTLLPENASVQMVGGKDNEFFASGRNWPLDNYRDYQYAGNWRMEASPSENVAETRFCHVLQASDTGVATPVKAELIRDGEEDVVKVAGKTLRFRRTGKVGFRME